MEDFEGKVYRLVSAIEERKLKTKVKLKNIDKKKCIAVGGNVAILGLGIGICTVNLPAGIVLVVTSVSALMSEAMHEAAHHGVTAGYAVEIIEGHVEGHQAIKKSLPIGLLM